MAERVFAGKLERAGFIDVWVGAHRPFGIDEATMYPLFTSEVIDVMRRTIPPEHQDHVATGVIVKARKPGVEPDLIGEQ
jgi:arsenite methyltransferase